MVVPTPDQNKDLVLSLIKIVSQRLRLIDEQVRTAGIALGQARYSPREALNLVEEIAPGCIDAVYLSLYEGVSPKQLTGADDAGK